MVRSHSRSISRDRLHRCSLLSPIHHLPVELIDVILSFCDSQTLLACSLVCRSWLPYNRYYLFSQTDKRISISRDNAEEFASVLLSPSNSISPYLRKIDLRLSDNKKDAVSDEMLWLSDLLIPALTASHKITSLALHFMLLRGAELFIESRSSLIKTFMNIRELDVDYVNYVSLVDAIQFSCSFPLLESLKLQAIVRENFLGGNYQREFSRLRCCLPKQLTNLSLHFPWVVDLQVGTMKWLAEQQSCNLTSLTVGFIHHACFPVLESYIVGLKTLKHVTLDNLEIEFPAQRLNFDDLPSLTSVKLFPFVNSFGASPVAFVYQSLLSIPTCVALEDVTVYLMGYDIPPNDENWEALDELLLTRKHSRITFGTRTTADARSLEALLPRCKEDGKLDIIVF